MLDNVHIILVNPTHPGNIGATARAMKNMGLRRLSLVGPKEYPSAEATARAFWRALSRGGRRVPLPNGKGDRAIFDDNSLVVYRPRTGTPGSPAIEISIATPGHGLPPLQKIHFLRKGTEL